MYLILFAFEFKWDYAFSLWIELKSQVVLEWFILRLFHFWASALRDLSCIYNLYLGQNSSLNPAHSLVEKSVFSALIILVLPLTWVLNLPPDVSLLLASWAYIHEGSASYLPSILIMFNSKVVLIFILLAFFLKWIRALVVFSVFALI